MLPNAGTEIETVGALRSDNAPVARVVTGALCSDRAPVVSESGFPNDDVVRRSGLGYVVDSGDLAAMAQRVEDASRATWDRASTIRYMMEHHTWDKRVEVYEDLFRQHSL